ncbi:MAG: CapA family protein [Halorhabdus sp.]
MPRPSVTSRNRDSLYSGPCIDHGMDVVHGHSAHVRQGVEVYQSRPIIYDAGDFVDDYIHKDGLHNKPSALFELVVADGRLDELRLLPVEIEDAAVRLADGDGSR